MFFLIPLGIAAVSALSTSTIVGGAAVASTALALGLKHAADRVEENNIRVVQQAHQDSKEMISAFQELVLSMFRNAAFVLPSDKNNSTLPRAKLHEIVNRKSTPGSISISGSAVILLILFAQSLFEFNDE